METKKNLRVNCALCDVRNVTKELLDGYGEIRINAAAVITSPAVQTLLSQANVRINCANTIAMEEDVRFSIINGPMSITASQTVPEEKLFLVANGPVDIEAGCEAVLKSYAGMSINGPVTCPENIAGLLGGFQINGPVRAYPDGAIRLKNRTVLDRVFYLRARQDALYYASSKIVALASDIDFGKLAEKNVRFVTRKLLVSESLAEAAVPLFDEKTDIVILPDGCAYVDDDAELNGALLKRYGGNLYIDGNLSITPDSVTVLDQASFLRVNGDLLVCRSLKDRALEMDLSYDRLRVVGGLLIRDRSHVELTAALLSGAEDGVSVQDCASVTFDGDVTPELLKEKLVSFSDCATVICANMEQKAVVESIAENIASLLLLGEKSADDDGEDDDDENTVRINSVSYTF